MTDRAAKAGAGRGSTWRIIGWGGAVGLILLPLVAMQFTSDVNWSVGDFIFASLLLGVVGLAIELTILKSGSMAYRIAAGVAILASLLIVWVNGAVGMIGSEDNPYNLLFLGVIPLALIGSLLARFRPSGMAIAALAAGFAQTTIALIGTAADLRGGTFSTLLAGLWFLSAALFRMAARDAAEQAAANR